MFDFTLILLSIFCKTIYCLHLSYAYDAYILFVVFHPQVEGGNKTSTKLSSLLLHSEKSSTSHQPTADRLDTNQNELQGRYERADTCQNINTKITGDV